jgi:hypothetical protein
MVTAGLVSSEASFFGLQVIAFSLCSFFVFTLCTQVPDMFVYPDFLLKHQIALRTTLLASF